MLPRSTAAAGRIFSLCRRRPIATRRLFELWRLSGRKRGVRTRRILEKRGGRRAPGDGLGGWLSALPIYPSVQGFYRKTVRLAGGSGNASHSTEVPADAQPAPVLGTGEHEGHRRAPPRRSDEPHIG